jgi:EAL domain-containing protein (putative c-di-GMP-specific phosphodiesterase class I)
VVRLSPSSAVPRLPRPKLWAALAVATVLTYWTVGVAQLGSPFVTRGLYVVLLVVPSALVLARVFASRLHRAEWLAMAVGLGLWSAGTVAQVTLDLHSHTLSFPSVPDALWLSMYPLTLFAFTSVARQRLHRLPLSVALDALIVALVVAALAMLAVAPAVVDNTTGLAVGGQVVNLAYPIADTALLTITLSLAVLTGLPAGRVWATLGAGAVALLVADATWALNAASPEAWLHGFGPDALYPLWPLSVAAAAWMPSSRPSEGVGEGSVRLLGPTLVAALTALGLLALNEWYDVPAATVILAAAGLLFAIHRTALALTTSLQRARDDLRAVGTVQEVGRALERGWLGLHFQPLVDVRTGAVHGAEALLRWPRGDGFVPPDQFLPAVERSPLVRPLTDFVVDAALEHLGMWRAAGHSIGVSVNLAAANLAEDDLAERVGRALDRHGLPAHALTLEITETAAIADADAADAVLAALDRLGVGLSIDDFGTGHSSLARLARFPLDEVKVDRSFVMEMHTSDRPIVATTIQLAHTLGLRVVAEGVEDTATLNALDGMGCDVAQGYLVSRPLPPAAFLEWLDTRGQDHVTHRGAVGTMLSSLVLELGMDAAFISRFVDDRKIVHAFEGADTFGPIKEGAAMPRASSYCDRVARGVFPNIIPSARRDARTAALAVTDSAKLGAYVGVALHDDAGHLYGALCCISHDERPELAERDLRAVSEVAGRLRPLLADANLTLARAERPA